MFPICVECLSRLCSRIATTKKSRYKVYVTVNTLATKFDLLYFLFVKKRIILFYAGNEWLNWQIPKRQDEPSKTLKGEVVLYIFNSLMTLLIGM